MSKVSIQIETIDATSTQLVQFAQNLVALTNQTYSATNRIEKINCDTENTTNP